MAGELAEALAGLIPALLLKRLRDLLVKPCAAKGAEILIKGVLDECVGEREAPCAISVLLKQRR